MTLRAADLFDPVVHHLYERLPGTGNMLRQGVGRLVAGEQKQHVQAVLHAQLIPCLHYNSYTVFDRYPEWVAEEGSVQFDHPRTYCLFIGKSRISWVVSTGGIGKGDYRTDTY